MALVLTFTKGRQRSDDHIKVVVVHNGEELHIKPYFDGTSLKLRFECPKSFRILRSDYKGYSDEYDDQNGNEL